MIKITISSNNANFFYNNNKRLMYAERGIQNRITAGDMTEEDAEHIRHFIQYLQFKNNISKGRSYKIISSLCSISRNIKTSFRKASVYDIYDCVNKIKESDLSPNTIHDHISFLKRFYLWMIEEEYSNIKLSKIQEMKPPKGKKITKTANDILTTSEIEAIIKQCNNSRNRLIISLMYEGALRIGEIATMRFKDIDYTDPDYIILHVNFKTGIDRYIPIYDSKEYLFQWINDYYKGDPQQDDYVFITILKQPFQYDSLRIRIMKIVKKADIQKKVTPHTFRHSRITQMVKDGWQESIIKSIAWGNLESAQFKVYCHLNKKDIVNEARRHNTIIPSRDEASSKEEPEPIPTEAKKCKRCHRESQPGNKYCSICGMILS